MEVYSLPEDCKYENGILRGPKNGSNWMINGEVWLVVSTIRPTRTKAVVKMVNLSKHGLDVKRLSTAEFWSLVEQSKFVLMKPIFGHQAILEGIARF